MNTDVLVENLPEELRQIAECCIWRPERDKRGRITKIPYNPHDVKRKAATDNPNTFASLEEALAVRPKGYGLGIRVSKGIAAADLDHCIKDGEYSDMAKDVIDLMDCYAEVSPSGTGLRFFFLAPDYEYDSGKYYIKNPKNGLETYTKGTNRFLTCTGNVIHKRGLVDRSDRLGILLEKYMRRPKQKTTPTTYVPGPTDLSDDDIIDKASKAKNSGKFLELWRGEWGGHGSHSEADLALCNCLAFWTSDPAQIDRIFRRSGLMRDKWAKRQRYRDETISKALANTTDHYTPRRTEGREYTHMILQKNPEAIAELKSKPILTEAEAVVLSQSNPPDLVCNKHGKVTNAFINYTDAMERDEYLRGKIRYDLMAMRPMAEGFFWQLDQHPIGDNDYAQLRRYLSKVYGLNQSTDCRQAVNLVARNHSFHPVREFFDSLEWDGTSRIPELFPRFLGADRCKYTTTFTELVFSSIIERIYVPGTKQDHTFIIKDQSQGTGKSTMCRYLALKDEYFTDELTDFKDQTKAFEKIQGKMICEFGEMLSIRRSDIETIKAYLSQKQDEYRAPYNVCKELFLRQVTFLATTNKSEFLPDDKTGNRRFIPLICDGSRAQLHPVKHEAEARQFVVNCYAEMIARRRESGRLSLVVPLDMIETVKQLQALSTPEDVRVGQIQRYLDKITKNDIVCSKQIFEQALMSPHAAPREPSRFELLDIAEIMNTQIDGWEKYRDKDGRNRYYFPLYGQQRAWQRLDRDRKGLSTNMAAAVYNQTETGEFETLPDDEDTPFD